MTVRTPSSIGTRVAAGASFSRTARPVKQPDIALLLSTYQKPWHLQRVLTSIAMQQGVDDRLELIVTDDGSSDETADLVVRFAQTVRFPVRFTTHAHDGFQLARCRNEGVAAATAPYLLFLDGDCLLPPNHVLQHLTHRRQGEVMGGYCVRLDRETSERIDEDAIRSQSYLRWISRRDLRTLAVRDWKSRFYRLLRHPTKPKLAGGNIGLWRSDYERVNGYDENFQGWGGEDDDLRKRLVGTGLRIGSILRWTRTYHLWHPAEPSVPTKASRGDNYRYFGRRGVLTRCRNGLKKRRVEELQLRLARHTMLSEVAKALLAAHQIPAKLPDVNAAPSPAEVELAFYPGALKFDHHVECRILIVLGDGMEVPANLLKAADIVLADTPIKVSKAQTHRSLADLSAVLNEI